MKFGTLFLASAGLFLATSVASAVNLPEKTIWVGSSKNLSAITSTTSAENFTWDENSNTIGQITFGGAYNLTVDKNLYVAKYINFASAAVNSISVNNNVSLKIAGLSLANTERDVTFTGAGNLEFEGALNFYFYNGDATNPSNYVFNMTNGVNFNGNITVKHNNYVNLGQIYSTSGTTARNITMSGDSSLSFITMNTEAKKATIGDITLSDTAILFETTISNTSSTDITLKGAAKIQDTVISGAIDSIVMGSAETASTGSIEGTSFGSTVSTITMYGGSISDSTFSNTISNINLYNSAKLRYADSGIYKFVNVNASGDSELNITGSYYRTNLNVSGNASVVINTSTIELGNGDNIANSINSTKTTYLGSWLIFNKGKTSISSQVVAGKVDLKSELTLNVENAIKKGSLVNDVITINSDDQFIQMTISANSNAKLILNANQQFGSFTVNKANFIVDLKGSSANSNTLSFDTLTFGSGASLVIYDFVENMVVSSKDFSDKLINMKVFSDDGTTEIAKELLAVKEVSTGVWSLQFASSVPEPAEWAMIFGAIALGFVAYRRRK